MNQRGGLGRIFSPEVAATVATALVSIGLIGCSSSFDLTSNSTPESTSPASTITREPPTSVVLVGDSLAEQAAPELEPLLDGIPLIPQYFGGTAPCDWIDKDLRISSGSLVVISFTGNSDSPCMSDGSDEPVRDQELISKYREDITALIAKATDAGARVLLVGQPVHAAEADNDVVASLNELYTDLVSDDVSYVDAGAAVENPDGSFASTLPCISGEDSCAPSGSNPVRSDDGLHFCPGSPPPGPCAVYSSGAFRFATAIAAAVNGQ